MSLNKAPSNAVFYRNQNWRYPRISHGKGIYLYGEDGKAYIDACSGSAVANIGHGNEEIADYTAAQMKRIAFTHLSRWTVDTIEECASRIAQWTPGDLNHVYFVSGGSESTETAAKLSRQYFVERDGGGSSKWKIISKWNSFHGNTLGSLSMTGIPERRKIYDPMLTPFPKVEQFYHYRNPWGCETLEQTSIKAAEALEREIGRQGAKNIAAFITEVVVGAACPGINPHPIYFSMVRDICDRHDILLIIDEVMSGFGRTGAPFASDHYGVIPDLLCMAKGMSCGYTPMGAVAASEQIFNTIMVKGSGAFVHGHTYAGNPLSCGIAAKVISIVERDKVIENSAAMGDLLMNKVQALSRHEIVGDIRGKGLMIGFELVKDRETKEPFAASENIKGKVTVNGLDEGIVLYPGGGTADGINGDHFLLAPPLTITGAEVDLLVERLDRALAKTQEQIN